MTKPIISVIIPCYNMGKFLPEAVNSVLACPGQEKIEIIIVNDGSTDTFTQQVLNETAEKHPQIHIHHQENQGLAKARNNGIKISQGKYILPLDADNKIRPVYISQSIEVFEKYQTIDIVYGNRQLFGDKNQVVYVPEFNFPALCAGNYIDACAVFRKTLWEKLGGYDENMLLGYEDWDFWIRAALNGAKFYHLNNVCFDYRVRGNSMVTNSIKNHHKIIDYMHSKKELHVVPQVAQAYEQSQKYHRLIRSNSFILFNKLINPIKKMYHLLKKK